MNLAYQEPKETQFQLKLMVRLDPPVKMVLRENQDYPAEMVSTTYPALQASKVNLVHPT